MPVAIPPLDDTVVFAKQRMVLQRPHKSVDRARMALVAARIEPFDKVLMTFYRLGLFLISKLSALRSPQSFRIDFRKILLRRGLPARWQDEVFFVVPHARFEDASDDRWAFLGDQLAREVLNVFEPIRAAFLVKLGLHHAPHDRSIEMHEAGHAVALEVEAASWPDLARIAVLLFDLHVARPCRRLQRRVRPLALLVDLVREQKPASRQRCRSEALARALHEGLVVDGARIGLPGLCNDLEQCRDA